MADCEKSITKRLRRRSSIVPVNYNLGKKRKWVAHFNENSGELPQKISFDMVAVKIEPPDHESVDCNPPKKRKLALKKSKGKSKELMAPNAAFKIVTVITEAPERDNSDLMRLKDDVLLNMFQHLDLKDLCAMAEVCKRFRALAATVFGQKFEKYKIYGLDRLLFRRSMRKFGHLIKSFDISETILARTDVDIIAKYCTQLEGLLLSMMKIDCDAFKPIFPRLNNLLVENCTFVGDSDRLFSICTKLNVLHIDVDKYYNIPKCTFPNLRTLQFDCGSRWKSEYLWRLLELNPQIHCLDIMTLPDDEVIENVVRCARNVKELYIGPGLIWKLPNEQSAESLIKLANLKALKKLTLIAKGFDYCEYVGRLADAFSKKKVAVECLRLESFEIESTDLQSICKINTLRFLVLDSVQEISDNDLISIGTKMPLLEQMQLDLKFNDLQNITWDGVSKMIHFAGKLTFLRLDGVRNMQIGQKEFNLLVKILKRRNGAMRMVVTGCRTTTGFNVPQQIQAKHQSVIAFDYKTDNSDGCTCERCTGNINTIQIKEEPQETYYTFEKYSYL
ncbi:uncharacterized protein LOC116349355 [Contarinia nasturtii]|uniref:uncharacterized protein LOC116349355 n=1 Tax=Contarinia nasturtii TaxID=265458 RepID=UPI0012D460FB|nr:uncharacterized protein LOC116349355 [Contarinia nasturtii]